MSDLNTGLPHVTGENVILPLIAIKKEEDSFIVTVTKFLGRLAGCLFVISMITSLLLTYKERTDLKDELACRSKASLEVTIASNTRDNLIAKGLILIPANNITELAKLTDPLQKSIDAVDVATKNQKVALQSCGS